MSNDVILSPDQYAAIDALLTCKTVRAAAKRAGVAERSLYRWLSHDANFQSEYLKARRAIVSHTIAEIQKQSSAAAKWCIR